MTSANEWWNEVDVPKDEDGTPLLPQQDHDYHNGPIQIVPTATA
jgi:hypothetical protein